MPSWKEVAFELIRCFSKCKCHIHSKCGKSCCDCDIDPVLTPQHSTEETPPISPHISPTLRKRAETISSV